MNIPPLEDNPSESTFQKWFIKVAALNGWVCHHNYDSRKSKGNGVLDIQLRKGNWFWLVELKSNIGYTTKAQQSWFRASLSTGVPTFLFRPRDKFKILSLLRHT